MFKLLVKVKGEFLILEIMNLNCAVFKLLAAE